MNIIPLCSNKTPSRNFIGIINFVLLFLLLPLAVFADKMSINFSTDYISGYSPLRFTFSEQMIPLGYPADSVPEGVTITPHIPGKWNWESQSTLLFSPDLRWRNGNRYTISIPAGVSSKISGNRLKQEFKKDIPVGSFSGRISHPLNMRSTVSFVEINFNLPVNHDSLRRHLSSTRQPLQLKTSDSSFYRIRPQGGWKEGDTITLSVDTGLTPQGDNMPLDSALSTRFNVSDTIKFFGLFRNDKKVPLSDTLFLEDRYELRFSHPLLYDAFEDYSLLNGKSTGNISILKNKIYANQFLIAGKPTTLSLNAGLPSQDSAFLFKDIKFSLIGDSNRIDPALTPVNIKDVRVSYDVKDSIPPLLFSQKTPVRLLPTIKFDFVIEKADTFARLQRSGRIYCFTPVVIDTINWSSKYIYPKKLPPNAICTLIVKAGYRIGGYQLKKDFVAIFRTGILEFPESCNSMIPRWKHFGSWSLPYHLMLPEAPTVPLERYGSPRIVTAIRAITKNEELLPSDLIRYQPHSWHLDTIPAPSPGTYWYEYVPIPLTPVLSAQGCGTAEVLLSVNSEKYDTLGRIVVTDLGMQLMKFRLSTAVVVTSLTKRLPLKGIDITLIGKQNDVIAQGTTDSSGFFLVPRPLSPDFVIAATPGDTLVYRTEQSAFSDTTICDGMIITERGLYRPGESLFFKGIVRQLRDRWEPSVADSAIVAIQWENAEQFLDTLPLSGCGSFSGALVVPPDVAQRSYIISAKLLHADGKLSSEFKVAEFRPAELTATIEKGIASKDSIKFTVTANWLHGGAAGKSPFTWICRTYTTWPSWLEYYNFSYDHFTGREFFWKPGIHRDIDISKAGSTILDSTGLAVVTVARLPKDSGMTYRFSATVNGSPVQSVEAPVSSIDIPHGYQLYIGIQSNTNLLAYDTVPLLLKTVREDGSDVKGLLLRTDIIHNKPIRKYVKNRCGLPSVVRDTTHVKVRTDNIVTYSLGIAKLLTTGLPEGNYSLTIQTQNTSIQDKVSFNFTISVPDTGKLYRADEYHNNYNGEEYTGVSDGFRIIEIDSGIHDVGDLVRIRLLAAQDSCNVLLTVSRENMYEHRWISMTGRDTVITLPLRDEYIPIVTIKALFFLPLKRTSKGDLAFEQKDPIKTVSVNTHVSAEYRRIPVNVTTDHKTYAPGDSVTVHITVSQKSASATALVMVVDEGVLRLGNTPVPDINSSFSRGKIEILNCISECSIRHLYGPFNYDSCNAMRLHSSFKPRFASYGSGFGGSGAGSIECTNLFGRYMESSFRTSPRPCAYFNPKVIFDAEGKAVCNFVLPGNLTRWRVTAIVDDTTTFGSDTASFEANKPLMIRPQLPRFLRVGDSVAAIYIVENRSQSSQRITSGAIINSDTAIETFTLHNDALRTCSFPMIGRSTGTDSILFLVHSDTLTDGIKLGLTTIFERPHDVAAIGGSTIDSAMIPLILPEPATIDTGNLELSLSTTRMQNLAAGVKYLFDYPYGCLEQQSSKIMPLLVLGDFSERFHLTKLAKGDDTVTIRTYLDHISDFQNKLDGGLGYWPSDSGSSSAWLTAFVLEVMIKAKTTGFIVNESVYTKAFNYLKSEMRLKDTDGKKQFIDSYLQLVIAQAGKPDRTALQKLYKTRNSLPLSAQINLLRAMYISGNFKRKVTALQKQLQHGLVEKDRLAYFSPEKSSGFEFCHESPVRQTALALEALLETGAKSRYDEPMIRWLTEQRRSGRWRTTQENMAVFRAFAAYTNVYEKNFPKLKAVVKLAGSDWFSTTLEGREGIRAQGSKPLDSIAVQGATTVSVNSSGSGRLYWDLLMSTVPSGIAPPVSSGLSITRTVHPIETSDKSHFNPSNLRVGELLKVIVTVLCNQDITFAVINDPIPAGCEAINPELNNGERDIAQQNTNWNGPSGLSYREFRDSRVLHFADDMPAGQYQLSYIIKPTTSGRFFWPAPSAEAMYYPEIYGRGAETTVIIEDNQ